MTILRRVAILLVSLVGASVLVFAAMNVLGGSPAQVILGTQATPRAVAQLSAKLGLTKPLVEQYVDWIHGLVTMHLGNSYISTLPIAPQLSAALQVTGPLVLLSMAVGLLMAVPLGLIGALRHRDGVGALIGAISQVGIALPTFVAGILLIALFAVKLRLLPASGFVPWSSDPVQALRSLLLPAIALGTVEGAILSRFIRSAVLDVLNSDYYRTARAKGLRPMQALRRHGWRNASIPVVTVLGLEFAGLIIGAIVVENVFTLPGVGTMLLQAVDNRDMIVVQDIVMLVAVAVLLINLLVDLSYRALDPRLRGHA
jgi:peptide/nickel transport system permease protein